MNKDIVYKKNGDVNYLQFKELLKYSDKLIHCYTLKPMEFSDNNKNSMDNYEKLCKDIGANFKKLVKASQKHTDIVEDIDEFTGEKFDYVDGFTTCKKRITLITKYADCTPIIIYDRNKNIISNVHSGWRGTLKRISQKAILNMVNKYNSNFEDIIVCIGPCIKQCHFQVEKDFIDKFKKEFGNVEKYYKTGEIENEKQKFYFDTTTLIKDYLQEIGIKPENIFDSGMCSVCNKELMHSYRAEGKNADRNIALVMLK